MCIRDSTYTIQINNQGTVVSGNYSVVDYIPAGMSFVSATDGGTVDANGNVVWAALGPIVPGQIQEVSLTLQVDVDTNGSYRNYAEISEDSSDEYGVTDKDSTPDEDPNNDPAVEFVNITDDSIPGDEDDHDFEDIELIELIVIPCSDVIVDADQLTICQDAGESVQLVATSSADASFTWTPSAGLNSTTSASPIATPTATTTYTVNVVEANGCESSAQVTITVLDRPVPSSIVSNLSLIHI